jgi:hypothetical protein
MSNKLWVKYKSSDGSNEEEYYCDQIIGLANDALVCDLRRAFVEQQHLQISPAAVVVRIEEGQTKLEEDATLKLYFIDSGDSEEDKKRPGKSKASALFLSLPPPPQQRNTSGLPPGLANSVFAESQSHQQRHQQEHHINISDLADELARKLKTRDSGPYKTAATRGREELAALRYLKAITPAPLDPTLPPILAPDALKQLQKDFEASKSFTPKISPAEVALTALLTPSITDIVQEVASDTQSGLVISNTEYIKWLPPLWNSPKNEWKKPDLITAHPAMLVTRKQNGGVGIISFRKSRADWPATTNYNFGGVEGKNESIDFVSSLWEGKCELGNMHEALGEMVDYVKCSVVEKSYISFILYDKFGFAGGYAKTGTVTELVVLADDNQQKGPPAVIPWDANGSKAVLMNLLKSRIPDKMVWLEKVRHAFNASWKSCDGTSPYLGSGAFGNVYRVEVQGKVQALKILKKGHAMVEFDTLKQAYNDKAPVVKVLVEKHEDQFSAYTMEPVGTPCSNHSHENVSLLFSSLFDLHSTGWYHGDARWENAIMIEGRVLWCDFLSAKKSEPLGLYYVACDLQTLAESLLRRQRLTAPTALEMQEMLPNDRESYSMISNFVSNALLNGQPPKN